jgi:hypothetical protein
MPNRQQKSAYRREGSRVLVDIKLRTLAQLYNSFDPSPFHERDLDDAAAEYIEDAVTEIHATDQEIKLVVCWLAFCSWLFVLNSAAWLLPALVQCRRSCKKAS